MANEQVQFGEIREHWNVNHSRILKYSVNMYHEGLNEHQSISASEIDILEDKVKLQVEKWNKKWEKLKIDQKKEAVKEEAIARSREAQKAIERVENLLLYALSVDNTVDWECLKRRDEFKEPKPPKPQKEQYKKIPPKPNKESSQFIPTFSFFEKIVRSKKKRKIEEYKKRYEKAVKDWEMLKSEIEGQNREIDNNYENSLKKWRIDVTDWEKKKRLFYLEQQKHNQRIEKFKKAYFNKDPFTVVEYCKMVLNNSDYPKSFPKKFQIEYNPHNQILIVEYQLPTQENLPTLKEVKYVASRSEIKEIYISDLQLNNLYNDVIYQITLRTIHELFNADTANALKAISFNGWVNSINKATGRMEYKCILSIQVNKEKFMEIQLENVDPKVCFKNLKGVASSKLSTLTPIQPILQISKTDKRFIDSYDVADKLDEVTNIAAMDWEDFEHLIREIFEKEFSVNGGEVKVTQASRDGGVDAIAFDPDPIRGGKIVIQAKRYTNTVGVSAVRDLFGTVVNEGATKGILVTTADYGSDAYEFAKGKPLTLLNGSNLLHLLAKHGYHAKIDLKDAKKLLAEESG